ncbi:Uncharacterised protein [Bordetella pertussis]|nr:Uncharacterised protein [Bordetella pertussis]CFU01428.1 Uncharacterised protein [Bordetella pertussis]
MLTMPRAPFGWDRSSSFQTSSGVRWRQKYIRIPGMGCSAKRTVWKRAWTSRPCHCAARVSSCTGLTAKPASSRRRYVASAS